MAKRRLTNPPTNLSELLEVEERIKEFIRGTGGGSGPLTDAVRTAVQRGCDAVGALPGALPDAVSLVSAARLCRPYWQDQGYSEPVERTPFQGGQCAGDSYRVTFRQRTPSCGPGSIFQATTRGPVGYVRQAPSGAPGDSGFERITGFNASGSPVVVAGAGYATCGPIFVDISVQNLTNTSDNCGGPSPTYEPGTNPPPSPGPDFLPEFDPQIPGVPFWEIPDIYNDPITGPEPVPETPGDEVGEGGDGGDGERTPLEERPKRPGAEIVGDDTSSGEEDFGEPPEGEVWVGFHLRVTRPPFEQPPIPRSESNEAYPRVFGNAAIKYGGESGPYASTQKLIRGERLTFITDDYGLPVEGAYVNVAFGWGYIITPLSVEVSTSEEQV